MHKRAVRIAQERMMTAAVAYDKLRLGQISKEGRPEWPCKQRCPGLQQAAHVARLV